MCVLRPRAEAEAEEGADRAVWMNVGCLRWISCEIWCFSEDAFLWSCCSAKTTFFCEISDELKKCKNVLRSGWVELKVHVFTDDKMELCWGMICSTCRVQFLFLNWNEVTDGASTVDKLSGNHLCTCGFRDMSLDRTSKCSGILIAYQAGRQRAVA